MLEHVTATRYIAPLREGGSLPGLMEADDLGTYVVKFRAAGQCTRALVAEVVSAGIARALAAAADCEARGNDSIGQHFRWLTAPRSTVVQPGPIHTGLTRDPKQELERLFDSMVAS